MAILFIAHLIAHGLLAATRAPTLVLHRGMGRLHPLASALVEDAEAHLRDGLEAQQQRNLPSAAASLRRAVELKPGHAEAEQALGAVLVSMGSIAEAEAVYHEILAREPHEPGAPPSQAKLALANLLLDGRGQRAEALAVFRAACEGRQSCMALMAGVVADCAPAPDATRARLAGRPSAVLIVIKVCAAVSAAGRAQFTRLRVQDVVTERGEAPDVNVAMLMVAVRFLHAAAAGPRHDDVNRMHRLSLLCPLLLFGAL